ncbi:MAG TPA: Gfo/Idh/MocA family oxidoreductase [Nitrososphaerales archaeon]|nr:Gfo/Idh/MocA family oxidoreductase [Nitrososphaerales archaeon]
MVRVAVVGTGGWGKNHVRVLSEIGALVAICDVDKIRADLYSKKYGVPAYGSVDEMSKKESLDAVTICTPASTHFRIASETLSGGLHTFVEKPMTTTTADAEKLIDIAKSHSRALTVGFIERFNPPITELKKTIEGGKMGDLILLEFHRENRRGENIADVGIVKDASVHDIDTARWLFAEEPRTVFARVGAVKSKNEDFAAIVMGFSGRKTAFLTTNWVTPSRVRTLSAVFTGAVIDVDFVSQQTSIHEEHGTTIPMRVTQEPLMLELREFVNAVNEKRKPLVTGEDGLGAIRIAEAVLASSSSGAPIYLG